MAVARALPSVGHGLAAANPGRGETRALLSSCVQGFALQEAALPVNQETVAEVTEPIAQQSAPGHDFGDEFKIRPGVIIGALTRSVPRNGSEHPS